MPEFTGDIYSPRWGHTDRYTFNFERDRMTVTMGARVATCNWRDGRDPEWQGEPLEHILNNDSIYAPAVFPDLVEHLWTAWRNGDLPEDRVDAELQAIIDWLNTVTEAKPRTDFWRAYF